MFQSNWRYCENCCGLWFNGGGSTGVCPDPASGGSHVLTGSGDYTLELTPALVSGQGDWRWCQKCQGLYFNGNPAAGVCPAGGAHDVTGSGDYVLQTGTIAGLQDNWRWCIQCQGLFFNGGPQAGPAPGRIGFCPAWRHVLGDTGHVLIGSEDYSLQV